MGIECSWLNPSDLTDLALKYRYIVIPELNEVNMKEKKEQHIMNGNFVIKAPKLF